MLLKRLYIGASMNLRHALGWMLGAWSIIWLVIESFAYFSSGFQLEVSEHRTQVFVAALVIALVVFIVALPVRVTVKFKIKTTATTVTIKFGDLFQATGHVVVPVNCQFDSAVGHIVAASSVHGQVINIVYGNDAARFEADVDRSLAQQGAPARLVSRGLGRRYQYDVGTTAVVAVATKHFYLFALTETDPQTAKARADVAMMWKALAVLWKCVRGTRE